MPRSSLLGAAVVLACSAATAGAGPLQPAPRLDGPSPCPSAAAFTCATLQVVPDAGHSLQTRAGSGAVAAVEAFLGR